MFSSSVDSTYTPLKLLKEPDDDIYGHHINIASHADRHAPSQSQP